MPFERFTISDPVKQLVIEILRNTAMEHPEYIISATAIENHFPLVTNDEKLLEYLPGQFYQSRLAKNDYAYKDYIWTRKSKQSF